jgi:uncharacterized protein (TIGR02001 family)
MWRGQTQTNNQPAIQGGLDVAHESGFYAGTWVSNVDFGAGGPEEVVISPVLDENGAPVLDTNGLPTYTGMTSGSGTDSTNYELDFYAGFGGAINDDFSYDVSGIYIAYPDGRDSDFAELGLSGSYKWFTLGVQYTVYGENDGGLYDDGDIYYYGGADFALPYDFGFSLRAGYYDFRHDEGEVTKIAANGTPYLTTESYDYWNFGASISREAGDFGTFSLNWDQNNGEQILGYDNDPKIWVGWNKEF